MSVQTKTVGTCAYCGQSIILSSKPTNPDQAGYIYAVWDVDSNGNPKHIFHVSCHVKMVQSKAWAPDGNSFTLPNGEVIQK